MNGWTPYSIPNIIDSMTGPEVRLDDICKALGYDRSLREMDGITGRIINIVPDLKAIRQQDLRPSAVMNGTLPGLSDTFGISPTDDDMLRSA